MDEKSERTIAKTRWTIRFIDRMASQVIRIGGLATIVAVLLVIVVLLANAAPIFRASSVGKFQSIDKPESIDHWIQVGCDEHGMIFWAVDRQGHFFALSATDGTLIRSFATDLQVASDSQVTSLRVSDDSRKIMLGFSDGSLRLCELDFQSKILPLTSLDPDVQKKLRSQDTVVEDSVYRSRSMDTVRVTQLLSVRLTQRWQLPDSIAAVDFVFPSISFRMNKEQNPSVRWIAVCNQKIVSNSENESLTSTEMDRIGRAEIVGLMISSRADRALIASKTGELFRWHLPINSEPILVDTLLAEEKGPGSECQAACNLLGRETMMLAFVDGRLEGFFEARSSETNATSPRLSQVHRMTSGIQPPSILASSPVSRVIASVQPNGRGQVRFVPTNEVMVDIQIPNEGNPMLHVGFGPRGDRLFALEANRIRMATFNPGYPEVSFRSLFYPIWYEGYDRPRWIWQSSSGVDSSETKWSLIPLLFGTFKATVYALMIGLPLSLLAAIYSSEFVARRYRNVIKPTIEWMATVPSVVLGFIAAFVLAPLLNQYLSSVLLTFALLPALIMMTSHLWSLLPASWSTRFPWVRITGLIFLLGFSFILATTFAPNLEKRFLGGTLQEWLAMKEGGSVTGWFALFLPIAFTGIAILSGVYRPTIDRWLLTYLSRLPLRSLPILRWLGAVTAGLMMAVVLGYAASWYLGDIRGSILNPYQERNAMLVGFVLGFSVIPIVYSLAEDALQSVPQHLRAASLGCGATQWQTTIRVVIPSALSGLFSAIMVGFGRAVGETMVVLMASGNTPLIDLNPFNGLRTLSATIATELPEAAIGSTHYRTLFLAALLLFGITLVANSVAEWVRIQVRKRASEL